MVCQSQRWSKRDKTWLHLLTSADLLFFRGAQLWAVKAGTTSTQASEEEAARLYCNPGVAGCL